MTPLVTLLVLDGWGCAPRGPGNAVELARTPVFDRLWREYPHTTIAASGEAVGLLEEIKADRSVPGEPPLLSAIADGTFGLMKRPADKGKGLDGVARKSDDYYNPATEILEEK